jgi:hypothetical protein
MVGFMKATTRTTASTSRQKANNDTTMDPFTACQQLIREAPSRIGVSALGTVAGVIGMTVDVGNHNSPVLCLAFLHAAARQLPAVADHYNRDKATRTLVGEICHVSVCFIVVAGVEVCTSMFHSRTMGRVLLMPSMLTVFFFIHSFIAHTPDFELLSIPMHGPTSVGNQLDTVFVAPA